MSYDPQTSNPLAGNPLESRADLERALFKVHGQGVTLSDFKVFREAGLNARPANATK